ncbi:hypothetical protein ACWC09_35710 [Streptomyces sp. NPDC001617]
MLLLASACGGTWRCLVVVGSAPRRRLLHHLLDVTRTSVEPAL